MVNDRLSVFFPDVDFVAACAHVADAAAGRFAPSLQLAGGGIAQQAGQGAIVLYPQHGVLFQVVLSQLQTLFGSIALRGAACFPFRLAQVAFCPVCWMSSLSARKLMSRR